MNSAATAPAISVVMPVYNAACYLAEAVTSVLKQDFTHFELLICDDGSSDDSLEIASRFTTDDRVRVIRNERNLGLIDTLHRAYRLCRSKLIARMDADDICDPQRLGRQFTFLCRNPRIAVVGGAIRFFGDCIPFVFRFPTHHEAIKAAMLFYCPLAHPAIMFRRELFEANLFRYNEDFRHAEDYHLWSQILPRITAANLQEVVLDYRLHREQVSSAHATRQYEASVRVRRSLLQSCGLQLAGVEMELHETVVLGRPYSETNYLEQLASWFVRLESANTKSRCWDANALHDLLACKFRETIQRSQRVSKHIQPSKDMLRYCSATKRDHVTYRMLERLRLAARRWRRSQCTHEKRNARKMISAD